MKINRFKLLILPALLTLVLSAGAQSYLVKKADQLYANKAFAEAIPQYEKILGKDSTNANAIVKIADCYRLTNNNSKTVYYLAKAVQLKDAKPLLTYYYAEALMKTGNYSLAKTYFGLYNLDERGQTMIRAIDHLNDFYEDSASYVIAKAGCNTVDNDFCPLIYKTTNLVFVSSRPRLQIVKYIHSWTDKNYYSLYIQTGIDTSALNQPVLFAENVQTRFNDGPICFDPNSGNLFITRNNLSKHKAIRSADGEVKLNLYQAKFDSVKKEYVNIRNFPYNSNNYNCAHPALNPDGTILYFSSDMPGTLGGMDIWMCHKNADSWSTPENLGNRVNTAGNEVFPYVYDENTLYFSSNGLEGIGGLDIYSVKKQKDGKTIGAPSNIGVPLNSRTDDFGICFFPGGEKGFFSSNRANNDLNDDIYSFTYSKPANLKYKINVRDSKSMELLASDLVLTDETTGEIKTLTSANGKYTLDLSPQHKYHVSASATAHLTKENINIIDVVSQSDPFFVNLAPEENCTISGYVYESGNNTLAIDSARFVIKNGKGEKVCSDLYSGTDGQFLSCIVKPDQAYIISVKKSRYFANSLVIPQVPFTGLKMEIALNPIIIGKAIQIENVHFDVNKSEIRPDAAIELDKIVKLMNENPEIIIELSSHTDCRGSDAFNMKLSDRRAKSSAAYIIAKGISSDRISGKGYGERQLLNNCGCEGKVISNCSEEEHQKNRRTEFKVTGFVKGVGEVKINTGK